MKLAILDRDGVINQDSDAFIKSPDEWQAIPGSLEAMARLTQQGWKIVIATNQSGIARGLFSMATLNAIHMKMRRELAALGGMVDAIFICPHGPNDQCLCRKPAPGMFQDIARRYEVSLKQVPAIGDSLRDLQAAHSQGCQPWLVHTGKGERTLKKGNLPEGTKIAENLASVIDTLLAEA
ncbi:D-glycero-beta-D-manno-heptose 1,7-bisphosphate 7-phosphatase [Alcaligenes endophyticus]|uniref:D,D-heptose 1,7-bisphosphate phosphatase n=1 Tax=Alcaligenes endophyticus TaxID=1929088 RepID=A0ABT8EMN7_9BURK|nr:D-glycero-beta-D-manno-heptose 1,7-bisphosphate 7-phosphatase [Alcaligenes endophyticus]MCX5591547.1 D-glycero-beta-D-manno-heptose 1,7-bisphosphate 7-phosphatase [Alcaligenes endophyticus]MDN4122572.1 D-glycero-beta-D-manno-heptose 1,7-bisphosphate 7-phosphatase [Alcaligenes endophyticus]